MDQELLTLLSSIGFELLKDEVSSRARVRFSPFQSARCHESLGLSVAGSGCRCKLERSEVDPGSSLVRDGEGGDKSLGSAILKLCTILVLAISPVNSHRLFAASKSPLSTPLRAAAKKHGLAIGSAASAGHLEDSRYAEILASEFNVLEPENEMKFDIIHPRPNKDPHPYNFGPADKLVEFAQSHDMAVRGHTLTWHNQLPTWLTSGTFSSEQLAAVLRDHFSTVMRHYNRNVYAWDVVNEAFKEDGTLRDSIWYNRPGIGFSGQGTKYIETAFKWARAEEPRAQLFYNDVGAETVNKKSDAIFAMATDFRQRGVPLDGIGMQMHLDLSFNRFYKLASFRKNLERFAHLGLIVHITEMDVRLSDVSPDSLRAQADLYKEVAGICMQVSACKLLQTWGFTDRYSWVSWFFPGYGWALLWDANYEPKPAYKSLQQLMLQP